MPGMQPMQYAMPGLPGYGFVARPGAEGMPTAMAATGYPAMQYQPGYPVQLSMQQHLQQVRSGLHRCY